MKGTFREPIKRRISNLFDLIFYSTKIILNFVFAKKLSKVELWKIQPLLMKIGTKYLLSAHFVQICRQ